MQTFLWLLKFIEARRKKRIAKEAAKRQKRARKAKFVDGNVHPAELEEMENQAYDEPDSDDDDELEDLRPISFDTSAAGRQSKMLR